MDRYLDFHSLRYSWATFLQRNGANSRTAMELMRHSDRKLTDKLYTDTNLLPTTQVVRNLHEDENLIKILTYYHAGRYKQLSQFGGEVINELIA